MENESRYAPKRWREGVVANLFKKGGKADPGNCGGITLLSTVGKTFCSISNDRMGTMMKEEEYVCEGQAWFRPNRSCVDRTYTLRNTIQSRKDAGITAYCLFLDIQKAYDTGWRNGLRKKRCGKLCSEEDVENCGKYDGMRSKCCDVGRGNIELC